MSALRSLDQRRAAAAYAAIAAADIDSAQKLPAMFQINGLLATWAYLLAKKEHHLLSSLLQHLRSLVPELEKQPAETAEAAFLRWVGGPGIKSNGIDGKLLRALTAEAIAWSVWLKRAAEARVQSAAPEGAEDGRT